MSGNNERRLKHLKLLPENTRPKVFRAIESIVERYDAGEMATSNMFPPRYGKGDIIRGSSLELWAMGAPTSVVLGPWADLANQVKSVGNIKKLFTRYGVPHDLAYTTHRLLSLGSDDWWRLSDGTRPTMITCTVQLAFLNKYAFIEGIRRLNRQNGKRVPVFIDECHLFKRHQDWGAFAAEIIDAGGYIVTLTGTPVPGMPGFGEECSDWQERTAKMTRRRVVDGEVKWIQQTYEVQRRNIEFTADNHVTWGEAWTEGHLTRANGIWINFDITDKNTGKVIGSLKDLTKQELTNGGLSLRDIIESDECIEQGASVLARRLLAWKRKKTISQALVVTGFDFDDDRDPDKSRNKHARLLKTAIEEQISARRWRGRLRVEIATGVTADGEPDEDAAKKIEAFRNGEIDILIVKLMGLVGLDVEALKVLLYMGIPRFGPLARQALSRPLTIWEALKGRAADIIMPADPDMRKCWQAMIADHGGAAETNSVLVDEEEVEPPEDPENEWAVGNGRVEGYINEAGKEHDGDHEITLEVIKDKYHVGSLTDVEILDNFYRGGFPVTDAEVAAFKARKVDDFSGIKDMDADLPDLVGEFGKIAKKIVNKYVKYNPQDPHKYVEFVSRLQSKAKELCGLSADVKVPDICDATLLKKLIEALPRAERLVF